MTESATQLDVKDRWLAVLVVLAGLLILVPGAFWGLPVGKIVVGGQSVMEGNVPYRDFWTMYAPGQFYVVAGLFSLFGSELIVQGIAETVVLSLVAGAFYILARRVGGNRATALVLSLVFIVMFWSTNRELSSHPLALLFLLPALDRVLCFYQGKGVGKLFQAGVLMGCAACFKHDVAGYVAIASSVSFFLVWLLSERESSIRVQPIAATAWLAAGTLVFFLPVSIYFAWVAGPDVWQDLIVFPATDFRDVRGEPFPRWIPRWDRGVATWLEDPTLTNTIVLLTNVSVWSQSYIPIYVVTAGVLVLLIQRTRIAAFDRAAAILLLCQIPFFWSAAHIQRNTHLHSMAIFALLLGIMAWKGLSTKHGMWAMTGRAGLLFVAMFYAVALWIPAARMAGSVAKNFDERQVFGLPGTWGIVVPDHEYEVFRPLCEFVRKHVPPDERIYSGVTRHDAIVINDPKFYFLTDRRSCCRYPELHPGITDRAEVQDEIIRDIESHGVRAAILWDIGFSEAILEKKKAIRTSRVEGLGAEKLDEYLKANFESIGRFGEYELMWRKDLAQPEWNELAQPGY